VRLESIACDWNPSRATGIHRVRLESIAPDWNPSRPTGIHRVRLQSVAIAWNLARRFLNKTAKLLMTLFEGFFLESSSMAALNFGMSLCSAGAGIEKTASNHSSSRRTGFSRQGGSLVDLKIGVSPRSGLKPIATEIRSRYFFMSSASRGSCIVCGLPSLPVMTL
jgi:hypothetical protein